MKKFKHLIILFFLLNTSNSLATPKVSIIFIKGSEFTDFLLTEQSKANSLNILKKQFTKLFETISVQYLTKDSFLEVAILDIDLPGKIVSQPGIMGHNMRYSSDVRYIKLDFVYILKNAEGKILSQGPVRLEHRTKRHKIKRNFLDWKHTDLYKKRLNKWFEQTFSNK